MSTEAEKSRGGLFSSRVSQQHFAANSVGMRTHRICNSVQMCCCSILYLSTYLPPLSRPFLFLSLSLFPSRPLFVVTMGKALEFSSPTPLKTETTMRRHSFLSLDRRARVNRYWKHGKIRLPD